MSALYTDRLNGLSGSLAVKAPCRVATTANITLSGTQTIDGVAVVADDRVLVKNQTSSIDNGIYVVNSGTWTRALDFNGSRDAVNGSLIFVTSGTTYSNLFWRVSSTNPIVIGTSAITFTLIGHDPAADDLVLYASDYGVSEGSSSDQTVACQAAEEAASALGIAASRMVTLEWPRGVIRCLNIIPRPMVHNRCYGTTFKVVDNATYGDHRSAWRQEFNTNAWIDVPAALRDLPRHFSFEGAIFDGNCASASAWTWAPDWFPVTAPGSYTALPTLAISGGAGSGMTATPYFGALTGSISAGGTGFSVGDEIVLATGTSGVLLNATYIRLKVLTLSGSAVATVEILEGGAYSTLPTGAIAQASVVDANGTTLSGRSGFTYTPASWGLVHIANGSRGTGYLYADYPDNGGNLAVAFSGGTGSGAAATVKGKGDYYKNGDIAQGVTEHNAAFWIRTPLTNTYAPRFHFRNCRFQNAQGDGLYVGTYIDITDEGCSSHNCFRGGRTAVCAHIRRSHGWRGTGWGLGFDDELSGGWMASTTKLRAAGTTIVSGGAGYEVGDVVTVVGGEYSKPYQVTVTGVTAGAVVSIMCRDEGDYSQLPASLTGVATTGGTGTGLTLTLLLGVDRMDSVITDMTMDTAAGSNVLAIFGDYRFDQCTLRGPRHIFLGTAGYASILFNGGLIEGTERAPLSISTIPPGRLTIRNTTIRHRPRATGAVPSDVNVSNDQNCVVMVSNSSGDAVCPDAEIDLIDCVIDGARPNRNSAYHGVQINQSGYFSNVGYSSRVRLENPRFVGDYTARVSQKAGLLILDGGDLGAGTGGGIIYSTDHATSGGFNNPYSAALDIKRLPVRGKAAWMLSATVAAGANVDSRYFLKIGPDQIAEADNLWSAVINGTVVKLMADITVRSATAPASATNKGGFAGMLWAKEVPSVGDVPFVCTTGHATTATWTGDILGSATYDPASLADGAGATTTVTATGAALGDYVVRHSFSLDLQGITTSAYVSAADTVSVRFQNESGGVLDLGSGTLRVVVRKA